MNPADFFMRELTINYPKRQEDDDKIKFYVDLYKKNCE